MAVPGDKPVQIPNPPPSPKHGPPSVVYGGLMRMGSLSMAHALARLDLRTHHALETSWDDWVILRRAAYATWPSPSDSALTRPFTQADWNTLYGSYDAVTDVSGWFAPQLIAAYPGCRVIIVQRNFDSWWESLESEVLWPSFSLGPVARTILKILEMLAGTPAPTAMVRILKGWFDAETLEDARKNARKKYDEHYAWIRETVPPERRLEYKLGDGWGPLCEFLGKEVPDVPFPRVNDRAEHRKRVDARARLLLPRIWQRARPVVLVGCALVVLVVALRLRGRA